MGQLLQTLSHPLRREVIRYFEQQPAGTTTSLEELVARIEGRMTSKPSEELRQSLYQTHLPTLQSRGWLEFDTERETISYHGHQRAKQALRDLLDTFTK